MPKNNGLSAVIITYNEERNIERCLASLVGVADEILVIDSFSTDKTEEICRRFNARFICNAFAGHIEQKNFAASQATYDYVLSLDADEALTDELRIAILKAKEDWRFDAYAFNRLTNYCGKWIRHCGWYPDVKTRLWNRTKGQWGGVNPHDKWELFDKKETVFHLKGDLLHYSYYTIADHVKQIEYFTEIAAKAEAKNGKRPSLLKIAVGPSIKFMKCFWFQLGFLDGYYGYVICRLSAQASFIKYVKTRRYAEEGSNPNIK